jgi:hypothetical protein
MQMNECDMDITPIDRMHGLRGNGANIFIRADF